MVRFGRSITVLPILHGKAAFGMEVRKRCLKAAYDCIAVDLPEHFEPHLSHAIEALPIVHALVAREATGPLHYLPIDPCDAAIEAIRQSFQHHIPFYCIGYPTGEKGEPLTALPDERAIASLGFDAYGTLCLQSIVTEGADPVDKLHGRHIAWKLRRLEKQFRSILAVIHLRHVPHAARYIRSTAPPDDTFPVPPAYTVIDQPVHSDHLYFALGELPFITGKYERERYDPLAEPFDPITSLKDLFRETRDDYSEEADEVTALSPVRIQAALTFLRNLTVRSACLLPSLFDIVEAAKGVGGNSYGIRILKSAKYYPWFSLDDRAEMLGIGIDRMRVPAWGVTERAINLLRDHRLFWRSISLRPDPSEARAQQYRYRWNPFGMCSHIPEDLIIERFNGTVRRKTLKIAMEDHAKTEKFRTSVKDGVDIRDTLRFWHTGEIYVRELPAGRGRVDTVIIIFDATHDERYPHRTTWYAEHPEESTLTFYATDPFERLIGPGIARCRYGGLSLLFPPRPVPDIFQLETGREFPNLAARLTFGGLMFSREKIVAYVAPGRPGALLRNLARFHHKHLLWIPLSTFSHETVQKLRQFHILNGKSVRSWAARFIGE
ncbi:MAG: hypothetical protein JXA18_17325 [Chitinispirillaceae bacterium]|nr:hypothetical protein [Chitinispirillaceae bacterium]